MATYEHQQQLIEAVDNYIESCKNNISNMIVSADEMNAITKIENIVSKIRAFNNKTGLIRCNMCDKFCDAKTAHLHQGKYIGNDCCWDERLRLSE